MNTPDSSAAPVVSVAKPVIVLKKFKYSESLSEETNAYTAIVNVDGVDAIHASNHGTGGPDDYDPVAFTPESREKFDKAMATLAAYAASLPPRVCELIPEGLAWDTELLIGDAVDERIRALAAPRLKAKLLKQSVDRLFLVSKDGGNVGSLRFKVPVAKLMSDTFLEKMRAKYPNDTILVGDFENDIWPVLKAKLL